MYQRNYSRPHENNDPLKPHLYWDGYQWIVRPHSTEEIIKLNEKKVQLVNVPLNYNLKKEEIKKFILEKMVEKDIISSKLSDKEKSKKIEDVELNKDTNVVLLTMECLDLAKMMILLDGIILLGHTIRLSLYKQVNDVSLTNIQKANALANSANVAAKSAAISYAAFESIFNNKNGKKEINFNLNNGNENIRNKDTSNIIKIMGLLGREDDENYLDNFDYNELYEDMNEAFSKFGKIVELFVVDKDNEKLGAEIGSVFIQYENQKNAEDAYQGMFNKKYKGNDIYIVFFPEYVFVNEILPEDKRKKIEEDNNERKGEEMN